MDFLVDAAIKAADFYTVGMLAVPLLFLGYGIKSLWGWRADRDENRAALGIGSLVVAALASFTAVPPYLQAREECRDLRLQTQHVSAGEGVQLVDGEFQFDLQATLADDVQYFLKKCDRLLAYP